VNASTTYDVAFTPELLYTLFYIGSVLAYLRYLDCGAKGSIKNLVFASLRF
jgi:hypothetical protein